MKSKKTAQGSRNTNVFFGLIPNEPNSAPSFVFFKHCFYETRIQELLVHREVLPVVPRLDLLPEGIAPCQGKWECWAAKSLWSEFYWGLILWFIQKQANMFTQWDTMCFDTAEGHRAWDHGVTTEDAVGNWSSLGSSPCWNPQHHPL